MKSSRGSGAGRAVDRKKQFDPTSSGIGKHHGDSDMYRSHFSKHSSSGGDSTSNDKVIHLKFYDDFSDDFDDRDLK